MLKKFLNFIKRIIVSIFLLYGYNLISQSFGIIIPINIYTVLSISILGIPALFSLIFILVFVF